MGKPDELVDMEKSEGINWKTGEPKIPLNQKSTTTSHIKHLEH